NFCYSYSSSQFVPVTDISAQSSHSCASVSGDWSGNFLNWASMTRMDIVRHVLFGGARKTDTVTAGATKGVTVLERVFLPEDTHSFVKVFEGAVGNFTPYAGKTAVSLCSTTFESATGGPHLRI